MSSYQTFAYLYDELTQNVEYEKRCDYILSFFEKNGIKSGIVLDLACGTGSMSIHFMKKGYNIIGLDYSEEMLEIASNRLSEVGNNFSLLKAKMQEFELSEKADACISFTISGISTAVIPEPANDWKPIWVTESGMLMFFRLSA